MNLFQTDSPPAIYTTLITFELASFIAIDDEHHLIPGRLMSYSLCSYLPPRSLPCDGHIVWG